MKKLVLGAAGVVAVVAVAFVAAVSMQSDTLEVERSVLVQATPADAFPYANDLDNWGKWNPWEEIDTNQVETFSEPRSGAGAWYSWKGNDEVGAGKMTILESVPPQKVVWDLHFVEPFESKAVVTMTFAPEGDQTKVTWGFRSENNFMSKAFGMFADMDTMLGADFQKGLDKLKPLAEADAAKRIEAERAAAEAAAQAAAQAAADPNVPVDPAAAAPVAQ